MATGVADAAGLRPAAFDLTQPWRLNPKVSLRPEPFGALAYHFGTRRLSFLKSERLLEVVSTLAEHADAGSACRAAGVGDGELERYEQALATLARTDMIVRRG